MSTEQSAPVNRRRFTSLWVVAICWATVIFDGYDLVVYGAVVPSLLQYREWALTPEEAGAIGAYALVGMLIGALVAGALTDAFGRRKIILISISWFSVGMVLCALAPSPELFGLFRFVTGLGLGGVLPTAIALTIEYAPTHRRNLYNALMFSGYVIGGVLSSALGIALISSFGWRIMFWIGALPILVIVPLAYKFLPESMEFLYAKNRRDEAEEYARRFDMPMQAAVETAETVSGEAPAESSKLGMVTTLFSRNYVVATIVFWLASFSGLLLIYGMYTWLPQIMSEAGYALNSALVFLLLFNVGAVLGSILVSVFADRFGSKPMTAIAFLTATIAIFLLSFKLPTAALYILATVSGAGVIGAQMLVNAWVAGHYPASSRATALGWSLGLGRLGAVAGPIIGGLVVGSQLGLEWNFYVFAGVALLGAIVIMVIPRSPAGDSTAEKSRPAAVSTVR